jgi:hypothetical protein
MVLRRPRFHIVDRMNLRAQKVAAISMALLLTAIAFLLFDYSRRPAYYHWLLSGKQGFNPTGGNE